MTKEEVIEIIRKNMSGCYTCCYSCDEQGFNGAYSSAYVDDFFEEEILVDSHNPWCLLDEEWELRNFEPVTNKDIDIEVWAQEFDDETIDNLRKDIDDGGFCIATFHNEEWGTQSLLVWYGMTNNKQKKQGARKVPCKNPHGQLRERHCRHLQ